ncbi:uncharacterized protein LOC105199807 [Solenopsis invicta]|uniref:uncharacterized protein LOC105199807 n=1 Tax=Solenopsis invicta TaxID=13686 RepID=UPI00193DEE19|nr:uncharacterized protein LOC105199807 [Solenopsis invicta]
MNGVIWNKNKEDFVPISSVPMFAILQQERLRQSRTLETHDFQLQNLTLTSFEEPYFLEFYDNDMKVTGICGELWTLLSEKLNFTLQPVRSNVSGMGASEKYRNSTIFNQGLLGVISRNETIAIPKVEMYNSRRIAIDFTISLWMNSYRMYIQNKIIYDNTWMTKVFSWEIWCLILVMYLLLSACSFWSQTVFARTRNRERRRSTISDHIFYNFGMFCNQTYIPEDFIGRSRIIEVTLGLFCHMLSMGFGALLFIYLAKRFNFNPPFNDLNSLTTDTKYNIVTLKGSTGDILFKMATSKPYVQLRKTKRIVIASTNKEMFKLICMKDKKKYILVQGENEFKVRGQIGCHVTPVGEYLIKTWVTSGIAKNFKYKRTIDLGIIRLKEVGLWNALTDRWLIEKYRYTRLIRTRAIRFDQVSLIILMFFCGVITALIIFIIEKIVYTCER